MPIKPENRALYPQDWKEIRARILERAKNHCEGCGLENGATGFRDPDTGEFFEIGKDDGPAADAAWEKFPSDQEARRAIFRIVLTIAHVNHDPTDNRPENLAAWCCQCHNRHDARMRAGHARETRDRKRGQVSLFGGVL